MFYIVRALGRDIRLSLCAILQRDQVAFHPVLHLDSRQGEHHREAALGEASQSNVF